MLHFYQKMFIKLSLVLTSLLTFPLLATPLKLPSAKIRMAVSKAIRAGDAKVLATVLDEHGLQVNSVPLGRRIYGVA